MRFDDLQQCRLCRGYIPRENFARIEHGEELITMLYCEHCNTGWESIWEETPSGGLRHCLTLIVDRHTPKALGDFLARLQAEVFA